MPDPFEEAKLSMKPAIERAKFRVFVFGPSLQVGQAVDQPTSPIGGHADVETHAKYLRHATRLAIEDLGFPVDYGESPDVLEFWQDTFLAQGLGSVDRGTTSQARSA